MINTVDTVVCLDSSLSISFHYKSICSIVLSILRSVTSINSSNVRMALIKFQSHVDEWQTQTYPFTSSIQTFEEWICNVQTTGDNSAEKKAIVDALDQSLSLDWRPDVRERFNEKLVILITDGPPCNLLGKKCPCKSPDLWQMADEFAKKNITLVVIGIEAAIVCDDFYCALAKKTGGEYLPLINAERILSNIIPKVMLGTDTFRQSFRRLDVHMDIERNSTYSYSIAQKRACEMYKYCFTMADIRRLFYACFNRPMEPMIGEGPTAKIEPDSGLDPSSPPLHANYLMNWSYPNSDFDPGSPPTNTKYINLWSERATNMFASTPVIDDEGCRTELPTTATSVNTSPTNGVFPKRFVNHLNLGSDSEIDDELIYGTNHSNSISPAASGYHFNYRRYHEVNIFTSTPVTDDEGYRTRLPTTASADTSFNYGGCSQQFANPLDLDSDVEIDDDAFKT